MDELRLGIVAHSAAVKSKGGVAQVRGRYTGNPNIDGFSEHVAAMLSHIHGGAAKEFIAHLRPVTTDNVDFRFTVANRYGQVMQQVKQPWIQQVDIAGAMIAKEMVKFVGGSRQVGTSHTIHDIEPFFGVRMIKLQPICFPDIS